MPQESAIVSRYISSMKKKPSLQQVINRAKQHSYKPFISHLNTTISQSSPFTNQVSTSRKTIELV
jgi:hypothetical protein